MTKKTALTVMYRFDSRLTATDYTDADDIHATLKEMHDILRLIAVNVRAIRRESCDYETIQYSTYTDMLDKLEVLDWLLEDSIAGLPSRYGEEEDQ